MTEDEKRKEFINIMAQWFEWKKVESTESRPNQRNEKRYCSRCVLKVFPFGFKDDLFWCPNCNRWMNNKPSRQFTKNDEKFLKDYGIKL